MIEFLLVLIIATKVGELFLWAIFWAIILKRESYVCRTFFHSVLSTMMVFNPGREENHESV